MFLTNFAQNDDSRLTLTLFPNAFKREKILTKLNFLKTRKAKFIIYSLDMLPSEAKVKDTNVSTKGHLDLSS